MDLGDDQRSLRVHAKRRSVADDGKPGVGEFGFDGLGHRTVEGREDEIALGQLIRNASTDDQLAGRRRWLAGQAPGRRFGVGLAGRPFGSRHRGQAEPRMALEQLDESLSNESRRSENADSVGRHPARSPAPIGDRRAEGEDSTDFVVLPWRHGHCFALAEAHPPACYTPALSFRNVENPVGQANSLRQISVVASPVRCTPSAAEDDFFCLRFQVWYPSFDCAVRTKFRTCEGCLDCEQGRFNLKRHAEALRGARFHLPGIGD